MSTPNDRISVSEKLSYGFGDTASNFFFQTINIFLLFYYTDVFGISAAVGGTILLSARLVDTVSDPLMGYIADRTESRWGKFRPYLLWMAIPYGIIGYLMFYGPNLSEGGKVVFAYATYISMMLIYTAINIPYSALLGVISPSSSERNVVASYRFFCAFAGGLLISMFVLPLVNALGGDDKAVGFRSTIAIFAVISVALFIWTFLGTKERVRPPQKQTKNLRADVGALFRNRPWIVLVFAAIFNMANVAARNGSVVYYFKYYVRDPGDAVWLIFDQTSIVMTSGMLGLIVGVWFSKPLAVRFEKRSILIWCSLLNAVLIGLFFFVPPDAFVTMVVLSIVASLVAGPTVPLVWAMYADVADYGEWKEGRRSTGLVFSGALFAQKMGLSIGGAMAGWFLGMIGFVANAEQSEGAMLGIRILFTFFPAGLAVLAALSIFFYRLDNAQVERIENDLVQRRATNV